MSSICCECSKTVDEFDSIYMGDGEHLCVECASDDDDLHEE